MTGFFYRTLLAALALWAFAARAGDHWVGVGERVQTWTNGVPADRVRLGVRDRGVYRVTAGEIADASGRSTNAVLEALAEGGVSLRCGGRPVAWCEGEGALLFYGVPTAELYAPENVYWLSFAEGVRMPAYEARRDTPLEETGQPFKDKHKNAGRLHIECKRPAVSMQPSLQAGSASPTAARRAR